jgi:hypothetical protein
MLLCTGDMGLAPQNRPGSLAARAEHIIGIQFGVNCEAFRRAACEIDSERGENEFDAP